jgi:5-formyltetrahydrofolate cyclo-ligase
MKPRHTSFPAGAQEWRSVARARRRRRQITASESELAVEHRLAILGGKMSCTGTGCPSGMADVAAEIAERMSKVALPDSRFGRDFTQFIPGFEGAEEAARSVLGTAECQGAKRVFVTPDNAVAAVRQELIQRDVDLVVPSYGLHRGFLEVKASAIPRGLLPHAGWLDAIEHFGRSLTFDELNALGPIDLIVTGASAITLKGLRFGMGDFYLDIEWMILRALGVITDGTPVIAVVHDTQVTDLPLQALPSNVTANVIVTSACIFRPWGRTRPRALDWSIVPDALLQTATLQEFRLRFPDLSAANPFA